MVSVPDCFPCALRQCRQIVGLTGGDEALGQRLEQVLTKGFRTLSLSEPPSTYTSRILLVAMGLLDEPDPFRSVKRDQNREAAEAAEQLDAEIDRTAQPLVAALMLAAAGNVLDSGPRQRFPLSDALASLQFAHDDSSLLAGRLTAARRIMYILDNAGEVVFDRLVLRRLPSAELTIVARSSPILNDVTVEEARELGLDEYGKVIGTGSPFLGIDKGTVSDEFRAAWLGADVVIAKGHANFESLVHAERDGFYILKAKCEHVARELGVTLGDSVCFYSAGKATGAESSLDSSPA